jgi:hypothetical protein
VVFALAGLFEARDRLEADRTREAAFRCFHLVVSRNDTMAAWELHKTRNLCTYLYCTNAGGGERNEAGLVLLRTDPRYRKVTPGAELVLWHHLRVLARECLSAGASGPPAPLAAGSRTWTPRTGPPSGFASTGAAPPTAARSVRRRTGMLPERAATWAFVLRAAANANADAADAPPPARQAGVGVARCGARDAECKCIP